MGNKSAKQLLEMIYGKGCMFHKARIAERIEKMGGIKTYKVFKEETRYKRKKLNELEKSMTYHHLKHKSEGGETDIDNGVIINELAHRYIHSLPRNQEEVINNMLRNYKLQCGVLIPKKGDIEIQNGTTIEIEEQIDDFIIIPAYDNTIEDCTKRFNRAKIKRDTLKLIEESLDDENLK